MHTRVVKSRYEPLYRQWISEYGYSLVSSKHRSIYAEMIFKKYCREHGIIAIKINPHIDVLDQIPLDFLTLKQQELLRNKKFKVHFFCIEKDQGYFVDVRMGFSSVFHGKELEKVFLFRVFEDGDIVIKEFKKK
ncbi:hypothetical protein GOV09_05020 [Candidatus Woesearchaeota archaeon]|nr:hypothetical protein [Candidatus Woesearchaeota archaeon]